MTDEERARAWLDAADGEFIGHWRPAVAIPSLALLLADVRREERARARAENAGVSVGDKPNVGVSFSKSAREAVCVTCEVDAAKICPACAREDGAHERRLGRLDEFAERLAALGYSTEPVRQPVPEKPAPPWKVGDCVRMPHARARAVENDDRLTGVVVGTTSGPGGNMISVKDSEGDTTLWLASSLVSSERPAPPVAWPDCGCTDGTRPDEPSDRGFICPHDPRVAPFDIRCHECGDMMTSHVWLTRHATGSCEESFTGPPLTGPELAPTPCTCGSGGHPRECKKHPLAKELHCAEMSLDNVTEERDLLEVENAALRRVADAARALVAESEHTQAYSALSPAEADLRAALAALGEP